jgi:hypothetical protein
LRLLFALSGGYRICIRTKSKTSLNYLGDFWLV